VAMYVYCQLFSIELKVVFIAAGHTTTAAMLPLTLLCDKYSNIAQWVKSLSKSPFFLNILE
jgi:hypothetical protein